MRINEIITESEQLDEVDWKAMPANLARGVGKLAGGALGAPVGMWNAAKQGYADTRDAISGVTSTSPSPSARPSSGGGRPSGGASGTGGTTGAAGGAGGGAPEATDQQAKIGVGQINKIIPTLRLRDLQSVKKTLDAAITAKSRTPAPGGTPPAGGAPASGGSPAPAPGGAPAGGSRTRGQEVDFGGKKYRWAGAQWVDVATGRMADRATAAELNKTPAA